MILLDGATGEGGGQILRTSLALSILTQQPLEIRRIRANRSRPGLRNQHLTAVKAAAAICGAEVMGAELDSQHLIFRPGQLQAGERLFDIGTAGSTSLVLQTVLPPLMLASQPSQLTILGGTHNPAAPTWEFLDRSFLPLMRTIGFNIHARLRRHGFYPRGGGQLEVEIEPPSELRPLELTEVATSPALRALVIVANLPRHIAERELAVLDHQLALTTKEVVQPACAGAGNALMVEIAQPGLREVMSAIGEKGKPAERVAGELLDEVTTYLAAGAPVGEHLADQLLLPLCLARGGSYLTPTVSSHTRTNINIIRRFTEAAIDVEPLDDQRDRVTIGDPS